jgi:hypothetical protein
MNADGFLFILELNIWCPLSVMLGGFFRILVQGRENTMQLTFLYGMEWMMRAMSLSSFPSSQR